MNTFGNSMAGTQDRFCSGNELENSPKHIWDPKQNCKKTYARDVFVYIIHKNMQTNFDSNWLWFGCVIAFLFPPFKPLLHPYCFKKSRDKKYRYQILIWPLEFCKFRNTASTSQLHLICSLRNHLGRNLSDKNSNRGKAVKKATSAGSTKNFYCKRKKRLVDSPRMVYPPGTHWL